MLSPDLQAKYDDDLCRSVAEVPLGKVALHQKLDVMELLIERGADIYAANGSAFFIASWHGSEERQKILDKAAAAQPEIDRGRTEFFEKVGVPLNGRQTAKLLEFVKEMSAQTQPGPAAQTEEPVARRDAAEIIRDLLYEF